jgi:6 kDa early secretory antigenic target
MTEQMWNFAGIEAGSGDILSQAAAIEGLLDEGEESLGRLKSAWDGAGAGAYQAVQTNWQQKSSDLKNSLQNLAHTITEAGQAMASTERGVQGMFGG